MYNSPPTPTGTTSPSSSSTYTRVFAIGFPIPGSFPPSNPADIVAHTVLSVGPYALIIRQRPAHRVVNSAGHASPATINVSSAGNSSSPNAPKTVGGNVTVVICSRCISSARPPPGITSSRSANTSLAPCSRAIVQSATEASKLGDTAWSITLLVPNLSTWACPATKLHTPPCVTPTPLGCPVEPDV